MPVPRGGCRPLQPTRPTPVWHRRQAIPPDGFGLLPVRSPLLRESSLFLGVLRCFSSPGTLSGLRHECPAVRRAGCPIRTSPDRRLPAPPRGISPRGRVLPRPPTPRHPPCAHHADILHRLPTGVRYDRDRRPARASGMVPSGRAARRLPRRREAPGGPVCVVCFFRCLAVIRCLAVLLLFSARGRADTSPKAASSPAAAEPHGFRVAHCQGASRPTGRL